MTTPGKNAPGLTGFPTPNETPDEQGYLVFLFPNSDEWSGVLLGAVQSLIYEWNWYQWGACLPAEASEAFRLIVEQAPYNLLPLSAPTPYWDEGTADDASGEMPRNEQIWYGEIVAMPALLESDDLTFLDNLGIWAIAGFIAYSGQVGAAIAFVPLAKKFVLAFKQHSIGGVVSVLVDFLHLADIDTYGVEDGVINTTVSIPDDGESHTLYVMMSDEHNPAAGDNPNIQVIRKRLDETEVTPSNLRWDAECDCVQQSPDGGTTWVDSPTQDPRSSTIFQVPARTGGDPKCDSAQQMHDRVKNMLDAIINSSDILQAINSFIAVIAIFFLELGIVIEAIWAIVSAIFSIGTTVLAAALTTEQYDLLLCIFYCNIGADGTVTADQFTEIKAQVSAQLNATAALAINQALDSIGFVGLTNAGALGEVTGDCSACDCGWCYEWDFTINNGGFTATVSGSLTEGTYHADGWRETIQNDACTAHGYLSVYTDVSSGNLATLDTIQIFYFETNHDGTTYFIDQDDSGSSILTRTSWVGYTTAGDSFSVVGNASATRLAIIAFPCGQDPANPARLYKLRAKGHGDMPAFTGGTAC